MRRLALVVAMALAAPFSVAAQDAPRKSPEQAVEKMKPSKAVPLTDAELDEITAGKVDFGLHIVDNPGKAEVFKQNGNMIHCVGSPLCATGGSGTSGTHIIINPAQTIIKCIGGGC